MREPDGGGTIIRGFDGDGGGGGGRDGGSRRKGGMQCYAICSTKVAETATTAASYKVKQISSVKERMKTMYRAEQEERLTQTAARQSPKRKRESE